MKIQNKQDVIKWLEGLEKGINCNLYRELPIAGQPHKAFANVLIQPVIKEAYKSLIEHLKSEEVA
tara:strand:+ start:358 stop:552 length:195 start_codon:yes stop_codon:yes gene_type:complete